MRKASFRGHGATLLDKFSWYMSRGATIRREMLNEVHTKVPVYATIFMTTSKVSYECHCMSHAIYRRYRINVTAVWATKYLFLDVLSLHAYLTLFSIRLQQLPVGSNPKYTQLTLQTRKRTDGVINFGARSAARCVHITNETTK